MYKIYKLYYAHTSDVYVGITSRSLDSRLKEHHVRLQRGNHHSYKLQAAYEAYGLPQIIEIDAAEDKAAAEGLEILYIADYASFKSGYNCTMGGQALGFGEDCPNALYKLEDYLCALAFLAHSNLTYLEIANECGVRATVLADISKGNSHHYLQNIAPEDYHLMRSRDRRDQYFTRLRTKNPPVLSPSGKVFTVTNAKAFAREHNLTYSSFLQLLYGNAKTSQGWQLVNREVKPRALPSAGPWLLYSPQGEVVEITNQAHFAREHGLDTGALGRVIRGKAHSHKGWTLYKEQQ